MGKRWRRARGLLLWLLTLLAAGTGVPAWSQVATTAVSDTVYYANGTAAAGTVLISWTGFTAAGGQSVPKGSTAVTLGPGGVLSVQLTPNAGATPAGSYYTAVYHLNDGSVSREYWTVPVSAQAVKLAAVRASVLPASVAMQTVTKQYVDQAIARAALGDVAPQDFSPYVVKTGDTMTGPLQLPGDPTAALQAATKGYVDAGTAGLQAGLAQKVSLLPQGTQVVTQPAGTQLQVNSLNGEVLAKGFQTQNGNDGVANALNSSNCTTGCTVVADSTYTGNDNFNLLRNKTRLVDMRGGGHDERAFNPLSGTGQSVATYTTTPAPERLNGGGNPADQFAMTIRQNALAGGNNLFPEGMANPYFKTTYGAMSIESRNNTQGQHVQHTQAQYCYGVGDCLIGSQFLYSAGGVRDNADEGTHPYDIQISEDLNVFQGTCATGCTTGSTQLKLTVTRHPGTQGDGRYLIDLAPSKTISAGTVTGLGPNTMHASALFSGTAFPVSTFFTTTTAAAPQSNNIAPGTVTLTIQTSGVSDGYSTNTAAAPAASGIACVVERGGADNFETANYTVVDGSHLRLTLNKPHFAGATVAIGGLCGYGLEQKADTAGIFRQVFPVIGAITPTQVLYSGLASANVGNVGGASAFTNLQASVTGMQRSGNTVMVNVAPGFALDVNGLPVTIAGSSDSSFNGTFTVTSTSQSQFTYTQTGANASASGGTATTTNGSYAIYPMAEVLSVLNTANNQVDGTMVLAPNAMAWAAGDLLEEPHFYQQVTNSDTHYVTQYQPRGQLDQSAGMQYQGVVGSSVTGWQVYNSADSRQYYGNGGTHVAPAAGMAVKGTWQTALDMQAGEKTGIAMRCNSHGCNRWNSTYNLFSLQSNAGTDAISYAPTTSTMTFNMRGAQYSLSPTSLTAGTINATTLNVTRINGIQAATPSEAGGVTLGPAATTAVLANVATSGNAADIAGLARSATVDATNASNINSGTLDAARLPAGFGSGTCSSNVAFSASPVFAVTCANAVFHMPLTGNVSSESFSGLAAGQRITLIFQAGSTAGYTVAWIPAVHGGFLTSSTSGAPGYTQAGKYLVQQLIVDTDGTTLLNPGAINE